MLQGGCALTACTRLSLVARERTQPTGIISHTVRDAFSAAAAAARSATISLRAALFPASKRPTRARSVASAISRDAIVSQYIVGAAPLPQASAGSPAWAWRRVPWVSRGGVQRRKPPARHQWHTDTTKKGPESRNGQSGPALHDAQGVRDALAGAAAFPSTPAEWPGPCRASSPPYTCATTTAWPPPLCRPLLGGLAGFGARPWNMALIGGPRARAPSAPETKFIAIEYTCETRTTRCSRTCLC